MTKRFLFALLFATGLTRLAAWLNRNKINILCYHSVTKPLETIPDDPHKLHIQIDSFLHHLDYLQAHYRIISLAEFVKAHRENIKLPSDIAILTFDDGFRNFFTVVAPIILARKIPATSFIVTGENFTQETSTLSEEWTPNDNTSHLSWSEVCQLASQGVHFGSHTSNHLALPDIPPARARGELEESLKMLQVYLGSDSFPLSYPHGRTSEGIKRLSQSLGYSCALTTKLGQNEMDSDLFALHRTVIAADDDLPTFAARLSGLTCWYSRALALLRRKGDRSFESFTDYCDPIDAEEACSETGVSNLV